MRIIPQMLRAVFGILFFALIMTLLPLSSSSVQAGDTLVGTFALNVNEYPSNTIVETWSNVTPNTADTFNDPALPRIFSTFSGLSSRANGTLDADDIQLRSFSSNTVIIRPNRGGTDPDGPGGQGGQQLVGAVQWSFDLSPIQTYLTDNNLSLTALDLDLVTIAEGTSDNREYDVLLSYTNPVQSITKAGISTALATVPGDATTSGAAENYNNIWLPLHDADAGAIAGDFDGNLVVEGDDLPLWETGYGIDSDAGVSNGDANGDGAVDGTDFLIWQRNLDNTAELLPEEGDIFGGNYLVLGRDRTGSQTAGQLQQSLLSLFNSGVTEFNLILTSGAFWGNGTRISIDNSAGLSISTTPAIQGVANFAVPEPSSFALIGLAVLAAMISKRNSV